MNQKGFAPILVLIIVVVLALGGYVIYKQYYKSTPQVQQTIQTSLTSNPFSSPTKTPVPNSASKTNLNPNTESLYGDIKVRLNEVLK